MFRQVLGAACLALVLTGTAYAAPKITPLPEFKDPKAIALTAPPSAGARENWEMFGDSRIVRNVTVATLNPVLPEKGKATGTAVVVAPGGAFMMLSMDSEGYEVARWLADRGIAAFVLKYRLRPTAPEPDAYLAQLTAGLSKVQSGAPKTEVTPEVVMANAVADGTAAIRYVRDNAARFGVDPHRIGLVGFSAGAMVALGTSLSPQAEDRPDFSGFIYGPQDAVDTPADAPPAFIALASNDQFFSPRMELYASWRRAKRPVEMHIYERGGHGFGMRSSGASSDHWIDAFYWWMQAMGVMKVAPNP